MAKDKSFDIVSKTDLTEVNNAVDQTNREIQQRYDFKNSKSEVTVDKVKHEIMLLADDQFKLKSVIDILQSKLVKRNVSLKALTYQKEEKASNDTVRQIISIQNGISSDKAKEIVKLIKNMKLKTQATIQEDQVRVSAKKIDDLQEVMNNLKESKVEIDLQFENFR
ncbi:MAG: YajQ family cyclic di-GMP-binding protein [Nitrospinota bacterium]